MSGSDGGSLLFLALPLLFLGYVFMAQRRRVKGIQAMQSAITVGDRIRTTAGLLGTVTALTDTEMSLEVAPGVVVRYDRRAVDAVVNPIAGSSTAAGPTQDN